jgi:hypothetical protein
MPGRRLFFFLGVASLLFWLVTRQPESVEVVQPTQRIVNMPLVADRSAPIAIRPDLPANLDRPMLNVALRDPFAREPVEPRPTPKIAPPPPSPSVAQPTLPATPVQPIPPPHNLQFAGRFTAPDGRKLVYLTLGGTGLVVADGQILPNGYRVDAITPRAIELSFPALNTTARLELPEPPRYEIR